MNARRPNHRNKAVLGLVLVSTILLGCGCCTWNVEPVDYTPDPESGWDISTPEATGLDRALIDNLYIRAARTATTYSVLVVKNGYLIAEAYFNGATPGEPVRIQSVTKSITSSLVGIAVDRGYLAGVDQPMIDFFPELADLIRDPRKLDVTIEQMLQMRAGYPWEESNTELFAMMYGGFRPVYLATVPLVRDPGTGMEYSNLTSHLLGIIVSRATGEDLLTFAEQYLFGPLDITPGEWILHWDGYRSGHADLHLTPRDLAKFGLLYLDEGMYDGARIVSAEWVRDSLAEYSTDAWPYRIGRNVGDIRYGYQWWTFRAGAYDYDLAWGHGGQQIALIPELDLLVVVTADPLIGEHGDAPWRKEKANLNLMADFIASLPAE